MADVTSGHKDHDHHHGHAHGACSHHHHDHGGHGHAGHSHHHAPTSFGRAFAIGITLNILFVCFEAGFGIVSGSLALLADAGHNLSDVLSLALAWAAIWLSQRRPTSQRTYGYARSTILASLMNAVLLMLAIGAITWEALGRLFDPVAVETGTMMWVAVLGIIINAATALLFFRGKDHDINIRGAYLHMAADAGVSLGVVIAALIMAWTGWVWIDPAISLAIVVVIALGTYGLLKESLNMALDAVPYSVDLEAVRGYFLSQDGVTDVHDLHVWPLSTTSIALTAHVVRASGEIDDAWLHRVARDLKQQFGIDHPTIQVERADGADFCPLAPESVV